MSNHDQNHSLEKPDGDKKYALPRDNADSIRLTAQHYVLVERQGWLLHPQIESALKDVPNPQIADVACGTGIWAMEAAKALPESTVTALDISSAQFPPLWTTPTNTDLNTFDVLDPVPEEYQHRFDLVHVRLLAAPGPGVDKSVFIKCFKNLLKPGGWLQWEELAYPLVGRIPPPPQSSDSDQSTHAVDTGASLDPAQIWPPDHIDPLAKIFCTFAAVKPRTNWVNDMSGGFRENGLHEVQHILVPPKAHLLNSETQLLQMVTHQLAAQAMAQPKQEGATKGYFDNNVDIQSVVAQMQMDCQAGTMFVYKWVVGIGRT